jgi:hypothetical protein
LERWKWVKEVKLVKSHKRQKKKYGIEITINVFIVENMFQRVVQMHTL